MLISRQNDYIIDNNSIKVVPISQNLNNIDNVRSIVRKIIKEKEFHGKILSIYGYHINDNQTSVLINKENIKNITCPFRKISRKI